MSNDQSKVEQDRELIVNAREKGTGAKLFAYTKLSGPGWLQAAITLGGGSLAGSLYLGVLAGYNMMWLQPLAMILGIVMLSAISYVTLSTGEKPFQAINQNISPVLGWGWAIATLMANLVWCMPQFALGTAALQQNLFPDLLGKASGLGENQANMITVLILFMISATVVWFYNSGGWGIKLFETILKVLVGVIVISFFGVVFKMSFSAEGLAWGEIFKGFIPNLTMLKEPAPAFAKIIAETGGYADYWKNLIISQQRDVMVTAAATAVGINMTFLLPYSMLKKGWDREFRGLAIFDLSTGLFIPFILATSCVVIASASQFHATPASGLLGEKDSNGEIIVPADKIVKGFNKILDARIKNEIGEEQFKELKAEQAAFDKKKQSDEALEDKIGPLEKTRNELPVGDRQLASMLVKRDAFNLADSLAPLTGEKFSQYVFGIGVVGMAISTIIILMLINGFAVCEMLGLESKGWPHRAGCFLAGIVGATGPFIWSDAQFWLAVPTSVFGMVLLPVAYVTFFLVMNSRKMLAGDLPAGRKRLQWNLLMLIAISFAALGSCWVIWSKTGWIGISALAVFIVLAIVVRPKKSDS